MLDGAQPFDLGVPQEAVEHIVDRARSHRLDASGLALGQWVAVASNVAGMFQRGLPGGVRRNTDAEPDPPPLAVFGVPEGVGEPA